LSILTKGLEKKQTAKKKKRKNGLGFSKPLPSLQQNI
jgi:hypothetical protein